MVILRRWFQLRIPLLLAVSACLIALAASADPTQTVRLKYRDNAYRRPLAEFGQHTDIHFKKEPAFGRDRVYRTALAPDRATKDYIGLAWDATSGKLYLDLNQNLDLTDDQPITIRTSNFMPVQSLDNVRFHLDRPTPLPYHLDITIYALGGATSCSANIHSGWQGNLTLNGEPWTMAVIDNCDGKIDHNDTLLLYRTRDYQASPELLHRLYGMPADREIFIGDTKYELSYAFEPAANAPDLVVTIKEAKVPTGELAVTGNHIERIKLRGARDVSLDAPHGVVRVPTGAYTDAAVYLYDPKAGRCFYADLKTPLTITKGARTVLKAGAPLDNRIRIERTGASLTLNYLVADAAGVTYQAIDNASTTNRYAHPPQFAVYKDGKKVASGAFAYG